MLHLRSICIRSAAACPAHAQPVGFAGTNPLAKMLGFQLTRNCSSRDRRPVLASSGSSEEGKEAHNKQEGKVKQQPNLPEKVNEFSRFFVREGGEKLEQIMVFSNKQFIDLRYPVIEFASNLSKPDLSAVLPITPVPTSSVKNPARKSTRKPTR